MKIKLNDSSVFYCRVIEFKGGKVMIDNMEVRESDFLEPLIRISDDDWVDDGQGGVIYE